MNKQTLDFLVPSPFVKYDLSRPPGFRNLGSGVGVKYARVEQAGGDNYTCRRISDVSEIESTIIFADWLWFVVEADPIDQVKSFLALDNKLKIIYGSELCVLGWSLNLLHRLLEGVDLVTYNTHYQRKLYRTRGIYNSRFLCDPIPEQTFFPIDEKERRLVCVGQISEAKRSDAVLKIFSELQGNVETAYIGGNFVWGANHNKADGDLHQSIQGIADIFIENATELEVAKIVNSSSFFAHTAMMDTCSCSQQENSTAGNITFALTHPTMRERTPYCFDTVDELVEVLLEYPELGSECHTKDVSEALATSESWSYAAWRNQVAQLLKMIQ